MSWFQRNPPTQDGPGSPVNLRTLVDLNGQLLFAHGLRAHTMTSIPCTVRQVDRSEILVEPTGGTHRPGTESAVILEVLHQSALIQCFTKVLRASKSGPIALRVPSRPHVVQRRRNQRVDIYLGVTIHTPDRPIEESPAQLTNLSLDGAACVLTEPITPGTSITINLSALGLVPPMVTATAVRCVPTPSHLWVVGLRFEQLHPEQAASLAQYITGYAQGGAPDAGGPA